MPRLELPARRHGLAACLLGANALLAIPVAGVACATIAEAADTPPPVIGMLVQAIGLLLGASLLIFGAARAAIAHRLGQPIPGLALAIASAGAALGPGLLFALAICRAANLPVGYLSQNAVAISMVLIIVGLVNANLLAECEISRTSGSVGDDSRQSAPEEGEYRHPDPPAEIRPPPPRL